MQTPLARLDGKRKRARPDRRAFIANFYLTASAAIALLLANRKLQGWLAALEVAQIDAYHAVNITFGGYGQQADIERIAARFDAFVGRIEHQPPVLFRNLPNIRRERRVALLAHKPEPVRELQVNTSK